jgi:hypothetical protein
MTEKRAASKTRLKPAHRTVLKALRIANHSYQRPVTVSEVIEFITTEEMKEFRRQLKKRVTMAVASVLSLLMSRGLVSSPGMEGKRRFYVAAGTLTDEQARMPDIKSRRQVVLALVRDAVSHFNRAVQVADLYDYLAENPGVDIPPRLMLQSLMSLVETGQITTDPSFRGSKRGTHLYLPAGMDPEAFSPQPTLTWLGEVAAAFDEIWEGRLREAADRDGKPCPISTGEVKARLASRPSPSPLLKDPQAVPTALQRLADTARPRVRKVKRFRHKAVLWAPAGFALENIDLGAAYASDAERMGAAVRRAVERLGRPVTAAEVAEEVKDDEVLKACGLSTVASILSDASKEMLQATPGVRAPRVTRHLFRVGQVDGKSYYTHDQAKLDEGRAYVRLGRLKSRWREVEAIRRFGELGSCRIPSIAAGRVLLLRAEVGIIAAEFDDLLERPLSSGAAADAVQLRGTIRSLSEKVDAALASLRSGGDWPSSVRLETPGWTSEELMPVLTPLYPPVAKAAKANKLVVLLDRYIRRIPNPDFESRFSKEPRKAAEELFDRTDALLYAASKWGGNECVMQAGLARFNLCRLRDERFVFPALKSANYEHRFAAVACLAFLWSAEGTKVLRRVALEDVEPGVRKAALWAYFFSCGEDDGVLESVLKTESSPLVRGMAQKLQRDRFGCLWFE